MIATPRRCDTLRGRCPGTPVARPGLFHGRATLEGRMSWDVCVMKISGPVRPMEEVGDDEYLPMDDHAAVVSAIRAAFPTAEWSEDEMHALFEGDAFSIEFDLSSGEDGLMLNVAGGGDPIPAILKLASANGWVALDCSTSEFLDPANPSREGWEGYQSVRASIEE